MLNSAPAIAVLGARTRTRRRGGNAPHFTSLAAAPISEVQIYELDKAVEIYQIGMVDTM
jgi:hypothetical protein